MVEIVTFDYIFECWKKNEYPENFDSMLEDYMETKIKVFQNADLSQPTAWLNKILLAIEIGILRNPERFAKYREYWKNLLSRDWKVSIEDRWIEWR